LAAENHCGTRPCSTRVTTPFKQAFKALYRTPPVEGNAVHSAQASQLEGEKPRAPTTSSEQTAGPATLSAPNAPKSFAMPAKATPPALQQASASDNSPSPAKLMKSVQQELAPTSLRPSPLQSKLGATPALSLAKKRPTQGLMSLALCPAHDSLGPSRKTQGIRGECR